LRLKVTLPIISNQNSKTKQKIIMDIVFCIDDNFVQHCGVTIISVCENNKDEDITFHILTEGLSHKHKKQLEQIANSYNSKLIFWAVDKTILKDCPVYGSWTLSTYYRILLPVILPSNISKVLYLDSDIIVRKNIKSLWNYDINQFSLAAVCDMALSDDVRTYNRLGYDRALGYFNAGILLINLDYWRANNVLNRLLQGVRQNSNILTFVDNDLLNLVLIKETFILPWTYNMTSVAYKKNVMLKKEFLQEIELVLRDPAILHFTSHKPWFKGCCHPLKSEYFKYLQLSPWKTYKANKFHRLFKYSIPFVLEYYARKFGLEYYAKKMGLFQGDEYRKDIVINYK
jgi:lipopolysaccharide biosynthesis glycosyltransferase